MRSIYGKKRWYRNALMVVSVMLILMLSGARVQAEDWKTLGGETYHEVQVIKVEPDAITILHRDGGARVSIWNLSPELQKRFNYDPDKALAAADARAKKDAADAEALKAEMDRAVAVKKAFADAQRAFEERARRPSGPHMPNEPDFLNPDYYQDRDILGIPKTTRTDLLDPKNHPNGGLLGPAKT